MRVGTAFFLHFAALAQLVERFIGNEEVAGSSPAGGTIPIDRVMAKKATVRTPRRLDEKYVGSEPSEGTELTTRLQMIAAYNYYNYFYTKKEAIEYLHAYLAAHDKPKLAQIKHIRDLYIPTTIGWIARLLHRQCHLSGPTRAFFVSTLDDLIRRHPKQPAERTKQATVIKENSFIADLEDELDAFYKNKYRSDFSFVTWAKANELGKNTLVDIAKYYRPLVEELKAIPVDKDLKEAYRHLTIKQRNDLTKFVESFVGDAEAIIENKNRTRKPRKKKVVSTDRLVKGLAYQPKDDILNLVSIAPEKIVGANQLLIYNTKTRKITFFVAEANQKLSVKGSSILNYDPAKSFERGIRKPSEAMPPIVKAGKRELNKLIQGLTTKPFPLENGRVNRNCILINVFA